MPERTSVTQVVNLGVEVTAGTAVAATRRLAGVSLSPSAQADVQLFRPGGYKYNTISATNREWSEGSLAGIPNYNELAYLFSGLFGAGTITTPDGAGAPSGRQWVWNPSSTAEDVPVTFTVEQGSAFRAHQIAYGLITELSMNFTRESVELGGAFMGRRITDAFTLTGGVSETALVPITADSLDVYFDTTSAGLGTTKLLRVLSAELSISGKWNPLWVVDSSQTSYAAHVEVAPDYSLTMTVEADAAGMGLLTNMRAEDTRFVRIQSSGPTIGAAVAYRLRWDMACKVSGIGDFSDSDGVYAVQFTLTPVHDATWTKAHSIELRNTLAAL